MTLRPTSVEPVNETFAMSGCVVSAAPTRPSPVSTLTTPSGTPASWIRRASRRSVSGVSSAGLATTVQPGGEGRARA